MRFLFRSSYMGESHYDIIGGPLHDKRIDIRYMVPPLYNRFSGRQFNYTPTRYARYVARVKGYMECGTTPIPDEVFHAFIAQMRQEHEDGGRRWARRHPDWEPLPDYDPQLKGTAQLVPDGTHEDGATRYNWRLKTIAAAAIA